MLASWPLLSTTPESRVSPAFTRMFLPNKTGRLVLRGSLPVPCSSLTQFNLAPIKVNPMTNSNRNPNPNPLHRTQMYFEKLKFADVMIAVLTPSFYTSGACLDEITAAINNGLKVTFLP